MKPDDRNTTDERDLRDLLARRAEVGEEEVDALRAFVRTLPAPRRRRRVGSGIIAAAAGVIVLLGGLGLVIAFGLGGGTTGAAPHAPDPAAFVGDPRLAVCNATADDAVAIFELARLRDYAAQLPNAYPLVGLQADPDAPALVIVFKGPGTPQRAGATPASAAPGSHDLCLVVGADAAHWQPVAVVDVDTSGLEAYLPEPTGTPIAPALAPWADRCGGQPAGILEIVSFARGQDASAAFPAGLPAALDTDSPATLIVYDSVHPFGPLVTPLPGEPSASPRFVPTGDHHDLCVLVGADPATAARTILEDVEVNPTLAGSAPTASVSPPASPSPAAESLSAGMLPGATLPPQIDAADCAALSFSTQRCLAVVERAMADSSLAWGQITSVRLAKPAGPSVSLGTHAVADVVFTLIDGTLRDTTMRCMNVGSQYDPACVDRPAIQVSTPTSGGYFDVPCGPTPGGEPGSACATPLPTVDPKATAVPLRVASHDYPLAVGQQEILVGQATLPNGILTDATFSLADPATQAFTVDGPVALAIRSTDPSRPSFENAYQRGWHAGSEVVNVVLMLDVTSAQPGATLQVRNLVVR